MQQKCPSCGHENRPGVVFCENCGTSLVNRSASAVQAASTKVLDPGTVDMPSEADVPKPEDSATFRGVETFPEGGILRMEIEGSPEPIYLTFKNKEVVLGRRDPATGVLPDVDLAPFAGYRMGVSRRHSKIRLDDEGYLDILDLGSSNGTFLNGQRLHPNAPYRLNNHDKIMLGQIAIQIQYQKAAQTAPGIATTTPLPQPVIPSPSGIPHPQEASATPPVSPSLASPPSAPEAKAVPAPPSSDNKQAQPNAEKKEGQAD